MLSTQEMNTLKQNINAVLNHITHNLILNKNIGALRNELLAIPNLEAAIFAARTRTVDGVLVDRDLYVFEVPELAIAHAYIDTCPAMRREYVLRDDADLSYKVYAQLHESGMTKFYAVELFYHHPTDTNESSTLLRDAVQEMYEHPAVSYIAFNMFDMQPVYSN